MSSNQAINGRRKRTKRKNKTKTENNKEKNERRYEDRKEEPTMSLVNAQSKLSP